MQVISWVSLGSAFGQLDQILKIIMRYMNLVEIDLCQIIASIVLYNALICAYDNFCCYQQLRCETTFLIQGITDH